METFFLFMFFFFLFAAFVFLFFIFSQLLASKKVSHVARARRKKTMPSLSTRAQAAADTLEVFDYHGTKIVHDKGVYTVKDKNFTATYTDEHSLPARYRKMLVALLRQEVPPNSYKLDYDGKTFFLTNSQGKKKRYKNFCDIPANVRKQLPH